MKISGVYEIINTITGDCYIGSSVDLKRRKKEHFKKNTWKKEPNKPLYKYMQQYGKENFLFKTIWLCVREELKKCEQLAIDKYNPKYNRRDACTELNKEEYQKQYNKEHADSIRQQQKQYNNQQCLYENEILTLCALRARFSKKGIENPTLEAKKYLIKLH